MQQQISQQIKESEDWDEITVEDMHQLIKGVEEFYEERGWPRVNVLWLANLFLKRLQNDLDYFVNCEGTKGYGKSNLMLLLSLIQCRYSGLWKNKYTGIIKKVLPRRTPLPSEWEHIKVGFKFNQNMSFLDDTQDVKRKFNLIDRYMPLTLDEGSKNLHKYQWQSKMQFMLVKLSDVGRYQNKTVFVCFPHFGELNTVFRNDRIMMRLYVYNKNVHQHYASAIISLKDVNRYISDPWHTDENSRGYEEILKNKPAAYRTPEDILYAEKKLKGYAGNFDFPEIRKISPKIWNIYMKYKMHHAKKDADGDDEILTESERQRKWKISVRKLCDYIKAVKHNITQAELARISGISYSTMLQIGSIKIDA